MRLPTLNELNTSRDMIDVFKGYNHNLRIGDGEFYDMKNLSSDNYPILSPRRKRGGYDGAYSNPQALISKDSLCYVDGADFVINGDRVEMNLSTDAEMCPKTLISMGAYVIIMPDKKWINTQDITKFDKIEAEFTAPSDSVVNFAMCKIDGTTYEAEDYSVGTEAPAIKDADGEPLDKVKLWLDTSTTPAALKQYSKSNAMWSSVATVCVKISFTNISTRLDAFEVGDGVAIAGFQSEYLKDFNNTMVIQAKGTDYIVVTGILERGKEEIAVADNIDENGRLVDITISRKMPIMDFIIESNNRLWGCHYGKADNKEVVNEIYASKLGDFKNWHCYAGISTDSYAATVGTDGEFTGAVAHLGYPIFFKENCMHKVYGNFPANYQIQTTTCNGVQKGSGKSLATVDGVLYYKSRTGICAYDGSLPQEISYCLGNVAYSNAVAGSHGNKYYISMQDNESEWHLFVYDASKGMWHKEDNTKVDAFCSCRGEFYFISGGEIKTMFGSGNPDESKVEWMAETGIIGLNSPDNKYISKLNVRMSLGEGANAKFYIEYNSSDEWEYLFEMNGRSLRSFTVPIRPKRCDHLRIRIEGEGECKIFSIAKTIEDGSDQ